MAGNKLLHIFLAIAAFLADKKEWPSYEILNQEHPGFAIFLGEAVHWKLQ